jgi:hypothetical protein
VQIFEHLVVLRLKVQLLHAVETSLAHDPAGDLNQVVDGLDQFILSTTDEPCLR